MDPYLVYADPQFDRRTQAAAALRRLAESIVAHDVDDDALEEVTWWASGTAERLESGATVTRADDYQQRRYTHPPPDDGARLITFTDRPVSGPANATAHDVVIHRDGRDAVGIARFTRLDEASPGRAHGGVTAAVFDDVMGYVMIIEATAAYTGELTVRYRAPAPLFEPIEFRARVTERAGRVWTISGQAHTEAGLLVAEAEAKFVVVPPERFGLPPRDEPAMPAPSV